MSPPNRCLPIPQNLICENPIPIIASENLASSPERSCREEPTLLVSSLPRLNAAPSILLREQGSRSTLFAAPSLEGAASSAVREESTIGSLLIGIASIIFLPLSLSGCSGSENNPDASREVPRPTEPPRQDGGSGGMDASVSPNAPQAPLYQSNLLHGDSPCGSAALISDLDWNDQGGLGLCANYTQSQYHLFRWDPLTAGAISSVVALPFPPDQLFRSSGGEVYISTYQNSGLTRLNAALTAQTHLPFPSSLINTGLSSSGRIVGNFAPSFPKGVLEMNGRIFVATSNYNALQQDYSPGTVLVLNPPATSYQSIQTTDYNPTSLAEVEYQGNRVLMVVNGGALSRQGLPQSSSSIDLINPATLERVATIPLGNVGAGLNGEVAVSSDRRQVVLPTGDNSGQVIVVNLQTLERQTIRLRDFGLTGERALLSSVQLTEDARAAFVTNFNEGTLYVIPLNGTVGSVQRIVLDSNLNDGEGIGESFWRNGELFVTIGSHIQRIQFNH
ncbi:MAG: hypothetical protein JNK65_07625 [Deltaproteobacteria bacterium]|nr:hypothetical protein [Deltaproteobacteria bacterium]